jgi:sulfur transfer complex TusBCD TusB component (DsrH family)
VVDRPVLLYVLYTDLGTRNRSVVLAPVLLYVLYTDLGTRNRSVVLAPLIYANSVFFLVFKVADDK